MVRLKSRYLVVNYLYPVAPQASKARDAVPDLLEFHRNTPDDFSAGVLLKAIRDGVADLFGDYGIGVVSANLKVNYHSTSTSTSIVRCPQAHYEMVWAALTFMTRLPKAGVPVVVRVVHVSGTIRKAEEDVIKRAKELILKARIAAEAGTAPESGPLKDILQAVEKRKDVVMKDADDDEAESDSD